MSRRFTAKIERIIDTAVVLGSSATIPLTLLLEEGWHKAWIQSTDWLIWGVFLIEFGLKLVLGKVSGRQKLFLAGVIVVSFPALPVLLGLVRVVRLSRVLR